MDNILVSDEDKHILTDFKWCLTKDGLITTIKRKKWAHQFKIILNQFI
jgi:hypothetical protein